MFNRFYSLKKYKSKQIEKLTLSQTEFSLYKNSNKSQKKLSATTVKS